MASPPESQFPATLIFLILAFLFFGLLFLTRWSRRRRTEQKARSWPAIEAVVHNSFELNESSRNVADEGHLAEYEHRWITAIEYSYQVNGEFYAGTYFLPSSYTDSGIASAEGKAWLGEKITIRYDPSHPEKSAFLEADGAPGKSRIPRSREDRPYVTTLSLK